MGQPWRQEGISDTQLMTSDTEWLQDALTQVSDDADLDCLSFLLDTEEEHVEASSHQADPHNVKVSSSVSAAIQIQRLVGIKQTVYGLLQDNESYIETLEKALQATKKVGQDLDAIELCLKRADLAEQEDKVADILPLQAKRVRLPLYPGIYQQVPLLAAQSEEIEQLRLLVCSFPWSTEEAAKLKKAVLNQCLRVSTLQLAASSSCPDDLLEVVVRLTEEELSKVSLPSDRFLKEEIDWSDIADRVGGTHTAEECRTRWLMVERPGINKEEWTAEESSQLENVLQEHIKQAKDGIICDWEGVARQLNTGRLGIDCFMQSQQEDLVPVHASSNARAWSQMAMSDREKEVATHLHSIWNDEALVAARLGTDRPRDQVTFPSEAKKLAKKYNWSLRADNALIVFVAKECKLKRSQLSTQLDTLNVIDFSKEFRRRPANVSARAVEKRWNHLKTEHRKGNLSFSVSKAKDGTTSEHS